MENNIKYLTKTFQKMGKLEILEADHQFNTKLFRDFLNKYEIRPYFFKGQETNKNTVVESNTKTVKNFEIHIQFWNSSGHSVHVGY
jgi:hypothetical protein